MSFFWGFKSSKSFALAVDAKHCDPFVPVLPKLNAHESRRIVLSGSPLILHVEVLRHVTQVAKAVICFIAVDVVNVIARPFARHIQPREAVGRVRLAANHEIEVSGLVGPSVFGGCVSKKADKIPRVGLVADKSTKALGCHFWCIHT